MNRASTFQRFFVIFLSAGGLSACIPNGGDYYPLGAETGFFPSTDSPDFNPGAFICGQNEEFPEPNVVPAYDQHLTGQGQYVACYAVSSLYDIRIDAWTENHPSRICAFPVEYIDAQTVILKPDLETWRPLSICSNMSESRAFFTFDMIKFNAVIVVPEQDREPMTSCLESGQSWACPEYSFGIFR